MSLLRPALPALLALHLTLAGLTTSAASLQTGLHYYAVVDLGRGEVVQRGRAGDNGIAFDQLILGARRPYRILLLQAASFRVAEQSLVTPDSGSTFTLGEFRLSASRAGDADADGLPDDAELIVGTDPQHPDTDGDGLSDAAEVRNGEDPLSGLASRTGIIASVRTPGPALDICAINNLALVALGDRGVAAFNIFSGLEPVITAQVDTPGFARRIACSGTLIAVADGPAGLAVVDIADPPAARITRQIALGGEALSVTTAGSLAVVGLAYGEVVVADMITGDVLARRSLNGAVVDVAFGGDLLYALTADTLHTLRLTAAELDLLSSVNSPANPPLIHERLFIGGGIAYTVHGESFNTLSLANPTLPSLLLRRTSTSTGWEQFVLANPRTGVAAVGPQPFPNATFDVSLYDASDPAAPAQILTTFATPGAARSVAVYNGLVYVADQDEGLQVVNFLPRDTARIAPTIRLVPSSSSDRAEENTLFAVTADANDDVQIRNVEFYLDGRLIATDGSYPYDLRFLVPPLGQGRDFFTLQAIATDLGGNRAPSESRTLQIVADATPPRAVRFSPANGTLVRDLAAVGVYFTEPLDPASLTPDSLILRGAGSDRAFNTADDILFPDAALSFETTSLAAFLAPVAAIPPGLYRLEFTPALRDLAGNPIASGGAAIFGLFEEGSDGDGDCLPDSLELLLGLDPARPDSNGNGVPDGDEDADSDGLSNCGEILVGADPGRSDSDGDGIRDGDEDSDGDGLSDGEEVIAGADGVITNPRLDDSDGDGLSDGAEIALGTNPLDPSDGKGDIVIDNRTVALPGRVRLSSLTLRNGAVLTHPAYTGSRTLGLHLIVTNLTVDASSRVDVSGKGYPGGLSGYNATSTAGRTIGNQPGSLRRNGGSHGGLGGFGDAEASPAPVHGDPLLPVELGGGGGSDSGPSGTGGGRFQLEAASLQLDGQILANGTDGSQFGGGGAGGSILLQVNRLSGDGTFAAHGGNGGRNSGGGGGGRIALYAAQATGAAAANLSVLPGSGLSPGGPGTLYTEIGNNPPHLVLRGGGRESILPALSIPGILTLDAVAIAASSITADQLILTNGAVLTHLQASPENPTRLLLNLDTLTIDTASRVDLTARGFLGGLQTGNPVWNGLAPAGVPGSQRRAGGSHGGIGGTGDVEGITGALYGDYTAPTLPGAGGGSDSGPAGNGGGALRLIARRVVVDGLIAADGGNPSQFGGGGAGGSLWITVQQIAGSGVLRAQGGPAGNNSGGGGGGRIALYAQQVDDGIASRIATTPGTGPGGSGGSGSLYFAIGNEPAHLIYRDGGRESFIPTLTHQGRLTLEGTRIASLSVTTTDLVLTNGGVLTHPQASPENPTRLLLNLDTLTIDTASRIDLTARGFLGANQPGNPFSNGRAPADVPASQRRAGGSHGGIGGTGDAEGITGALYGDYAAPALPGAGGGSDSGPAGNGGGALRLIARRVVVDGLIAADGGNPSQFGGGGAGGSLWITVQQIAGSGVLRAQGGPAGNNSGGGGGGRIALYAQQVDDGIASRIATTPGSGPGGPGGSGSLYFAIGNEPAHLIYRDGGRESFIPTLTHQGRLTLEGTRIASLSVTATDLVLTNGGILTHPQATPDLPHRLVLNAGLLTISSNSAIDLTARGFLGGNQPGNPSSNGRAPADVPASQRRTGGSHGGIGGTGDAEGITGDVYGDYAAPTLPGAGGGSDSGPAGNGGGALRLTAQRLVVDGLITADGGNASQFGGGGAGGSLWITVEQLEGSGVIRAQGGLGANNSGAGGGGRIALEFPGSTASVASTLSVLSPPSIYPGGSGTLFLRRGNEAPQLIIRAPGRETPLPVGQPSHHLLVETRTQVVGGRLEFGEILVDGATLSATNVRSSLIALRHGAVLTHPPTTLTELGGIELVANRLTLDVTSRLDASDRGYLGAWRGANAGVSDGRTLNQALGSTRRNGGSHAGLGAVGSTGGVVNPVYGDADAPATAGSGGGSDSGPAGNGGGRIRINATLLEVDGQILADGGAGSLYGGGGSGGSILITTDRLTGSGGIHARGGTGSDTAGSGGGGRIAIIHRTLDLPAANITAAGGAGPLPASDGTVRTIAR